jgi:acyl-CoA synthetase (AMP-forming)/AMP-acid ligase II
VPPDLKRAWRDELRLPLVESYGQSELGGFVGLGFPELVADDAALPRVGPPPPDKEVRIMGPDDRVLPPGEVGDIVLRGGFMHGYWGRPDKTAEATRGGWLRTGDLGLLDTDGFLIMRSRSSELVEVAGVPWYPRDVEEALCRRPEVREAALVGVPDASLGRLPVAVVVIEGGGPPPPDLVGAIASELPYDLAPLAIEAVPSMPMTPTGKIAKGELAAAIAARRAGP